MSALVKSQGPPHHFPIITRLQGKRSRRKTKIKIVRIRIKLKNKRKMRITKLCKGSRNHNALKINGASSHNSLTRLLSAEPSSKK
jgi:hypothetical protein